MTIKEEVLEDWIDYLETQNEDVDRKLARDIHRDDINKITDITLQKVLKKIEEFEGFLKIYFNSCLKEKNLNFSEIKTFEIIKKDVLRKIKKLKLENR